MLFSFNGRIRQSQWWLVQLGLLVVGFVTLVLAGVVVAPIGLKETLVTQLTFGLLAGAVAAALTWINLATSAKRFHDQDLSGWFYLISFVPVIGSIIVLGLLGFRDSRHGANRFGASAKYPNLAAAAALFD
ncbi:DUF805 domain-containing protein [Phenylobacterium sp.]|uniref:DUF805 domain-containing protein n=1 Tax=Phenylobacterium sp. TaxID=1871053 RepID=UPI0025EDE030|nr:DUF805 domain-containing protein [Phenylobacterium sp.]